MGGRIPGICAFKKTVSAGRDRGSLLVIGCGVPLCRSGISVEEGEGPAAGVPDGSPAEELLRGGEAGGVETADVVRKLNTHFSKDDLFFRRFFQEAGLTIAFSVVG